ncbi:uncharacterized protein PG986_014124 [Apiospora aurea]|uniref:Uncharacterized protein n=1 Tax=Apiospora aurea TaxID=335848 RepID=A0ABR1PS37_9PEZI
MATASGSATAVRPWDYIYLRITPIARSDGASGKSMASLVKTPRFQHWALQVRRYVYDVSTKNSTDDNDGTLFYDPVPVAQWETLHNLAPGTGIKTPIGVTFFNDLTIQWTGTVQFRFDPWPALRISTWEAHYSVNGGYKVREQNCQHFVMTLTQRIQANRAQLPAVPASAMARVERLPTPLWPSDTVPYASPSDMKKNVDAETTWPDKWEAGHRDSFRPGQVARYVAMGYDIKDVVLSLQRLGFRQGVQQSISSEMEATILQVLRGEISLDDQGNVE